MQIRGIAYIFSLLYGSILVLLLLCGMFTAFNPVSIDRYLALVLTQWAFIPAVGIWLGMTRYNKVRWVAALIAGLGLTFLAAMNVMANCASPFPELNQIAFCDAQTVGPLLALLAPGYVYVWVVIGLAIALSWVRGVTRSDFTALRENIISAIIALFVIFAPLGYALATYATYADTVNRINNMYPPQV